jgi:N-acetylneuraminic acid mutarotase
VDTNGIISTLAGHGSWNGELALESGLLSSNLNPAGVAIDPSGNLDFSAGFRVCQINFPYLPVPNVPTPSAALILTNVTANDAGTYQLIISSSCGSVTDAVVTLTVIGHFIMTGSMNSPQSGGVAVLLQNGKVLVVAGSSAELYNPTTETWSVTGSLNIPRYYGYTATLLSNGKVLVAGGANNSSSYMANAELYDPATGTWTATGAMNKPRTTHTAVLLPNGKVLVMGGWGESEMDGTQTLSSAELYDPTTGTWTQINSMNSRRFSFPAALLPSGKVLVAGGYDNYNDNPIANAELYDPATGTWSETSSLNEPRDSGLMVMMSTGKALIVGGNDWDPIGSTELYNPATGTWTTTGSLNTTRQGCTATPLPNGWVLVAGGYYYNSPTDKGEFSSAEVYNPDTGAWTATTPMNVARFGHTATLLANGDVLIAGGGGLLWPNGLTSSAELYRQ